MVCVVCTRIIAQCLVLLLAVLDPSIDRTMSRRPPCRFCFPLIRPTWSLLHAFAQICFCTIFSTHRMQR